MTSIALLGREITIKYGRQEAIINEVGARLHSYKVDDELIVEPGANPNQLHDVYKGAHGNLLMPWPNRVAQGKYEFEGTTLQLPINEVSRGHASHGFCRVFTWTIADQTESQVKLTARFPAQIGFPFVFDAMVTYTIDDNGLSVHIHARNVGQTTMPFGVGMHPYVTIGNGDISNATLTCPATEYHEVNDVMIPEGDSKPVSNTQFDLTKGAKVSELDLDTPYTALQRDQDGRCNVTLSSADSTRTTTVWMDTAFEYIMLYTGNKPTSVAIEPMTCAPDAFNNHRGLRLLKPGEEFAGIWGITHTH
jgi:aldose 1-epimerase